MAMYYKKGLTVQEAKTVFDKCLRNGGNPLQINIGDFFGKWIIGDVGLRKAFYLFEEVGDCVEISFSTNPESGITNKLLGLAKQYGFLEEYQIPDYHKGNKINQAAKHTLSTESICIILKMVVKKILPPFNGSCVFAKAKDDKVSVEDLQNCPVFSKNGTDFYLVSVVNEYDILSVKYSNKKGDVYSIDL